MLRINTRLIIIKKTFKKDLINPFIKNFVYVFIL